MKKMTILLLMVLLFGTGAMAQKTSVKTDQKVLKNSIKDKKEDKHEAGKDLAHLRVKSALKGRKEVRSHRKSIHKQGEHLENRGVKHPITKAKHQVKTEKDVKKGKD
jgi:hypothetical protein